MRVKKYFMFLSLIFLCSSVAFASGNFLEQFLAGLLNLFGANPALSHPPGRAIRAIVKVSLETTA